MELEVWRQSKGITYRQLGLLLGLDYTLIYRVCKGQRKPTKLVKDKVKKATNGAVTWK